MSKPSGSDSPKNNEVNPRSQGEKGLTFEQFKNACSHSSELKQEQVQNPASRMNALDYVTKTASGILAHNKEKEYSRKRITDQHTQTGKGVDENKEYLEQRTYSLNAREEYTLIGKQCEEHIKNFDQARETGNGTEEQRAKDSLIDLSMKLNKIRGQMKEKLHITELNYKAISLEDIKKCIKDETIRVNYTDLEGAIDRISQSLESRGLKIPDNSPAQTEI